MERITQTMCVLSCYRRHRELHRSALISSGGGQRAVIVCLFEYVCVCSFFVLGNALVLDLGTDPKTTKQIVINNQEGLYVFDAVFNQRETT